MTSTIFDNNKQVSDQKKKKIIIIKPIYKCTHSLLFFFFYKIRTLSKEEGGEGGKHKVRSCAANKISL